MLSAHEIIVGMAVLNHHNTVNNQCLLGWSGILVKCQEHHLLIEKDSMVEILTVDEIPQALDDRPWLIGFQDYNGEIISLVELATLLNPKSACQSLKERQVIVVESTKGLVGLLVNKVLGYRDYWEDDQDIRKITANNDSIVSHVLACTESNIRILDIDKLMQCITRPYPQ